MCEVYVKIGCLGCNSLESEEDIERNKFLCEDYQEYMKKIDEGVQIKWDI